MEWGQLGYHQRQEENKEQAGEDLQQVQEFHIESVIQDSKTYLLS